MKLVSENIPIAPYAQPQSVVTTALQTTFTGSSKDGGKMHCNCQYEVRFLGTDPEKPMPIINEGTIDLTPYLPPQLAAGLEAWFDAIAPELLKRLAPKEEEKVISNRE
jgi:hypothetical protein